MYRIKLQSGEESEFSSFEELSFGIVSGIIGPGQISRGRGQCTASSCNLAKRSQTTQTRSHLAAGAKH